MSPDKILLVKGTSGLGNRLQCFLTGILYARLSGRRLLVDWTDPYYSSDRANSFYHFFHCPSTSSTDIIPETDSVRPVIWRGYLHDSARKHARPFQEKPNESQSWSKFSVDLRSIDHEEDVLVMVMPTAQILSAASPFHGPLQPPCQAE